MPSQVECETIFRATKQEVEAFAKQLSHQRYRHAKDIRANNLRYVYKDCAREPPKKVDVLIDSCEAEIQEVYPLENKCEVHSKAPLSLHQPVCCQGSSLKLLDVNGTMLQFEDLGPMQQGDVVRQTTVIADIPAIFEAFKQEWEPRWNRHQHILDSQWDQICSFAQQTLKPICWNFPQWTAERFAQVVRSKKATAATGPDGVTRQDLVSLPTHAVQSILKVFHRVEGQAQWPLQLTNGIVSSLEKTPDAQSVKQYRPVVIYPIIYRVWSSARARQFLKSLVKVTPSGLRGGLPARQSKSIGLR